MVADQKPNVEQVTKHFMYNLTMNLKHKNTVSQTNTCTFSCIYTLYEVLLVTDTKCTGPRQSTYIIFIGRDVWRKR